MTERATLVFLGLAGAGHQALTLRGRKSRVGTGRNGKEAWKAEGGAQRVKARGELPLADPAGGASTQTSVLWSESLGAQKRWTAREAIAVCPGSGRLCWIQL